MARDWKLPPDLTPESYLPTVEIDLNRDSQATVDVSRLVTKTTAIDVSKVTYEGMIRAKRDTRASTLEECERTCTKEERGWRRGVIAGAALMAGFAGSTVAAIWAWLRWWR